MLFARQRLVPAIFSALVVLLAPLMALRVQADVPDATLEVFRQALEAARDDRISQAVSLQNRLDRDFPLHAYIDFHRLRHDLPQTPANKIRAFRKSHTDSPLPGMLERHAMRAYGKAGKLADIRALDIAVPGDTEAQCHWWLAHFHLDRTAALEATAAIWLHGQSQPASCDPLFERAKAAGVIDDGLIWQRMLLAYRAGNPTLIRYLSRKLDPARQPAGDALVQLYRQPLTVTKLLHDLPEDWRQDFVGAAFHRLISRDTPAALALLEGAEKYGLVVSEAVRAQAERRIAWFSLIRDIPEHRRWLDQWLSMQPHEDLVSQRARRAIIEQDWRGVRHWIARLPVEAQKEARWQYWLGRAWQDSGEVTLAETHFGLAATQRNFWGFLAADQRQQNYALNRDYPVVMENSGNIPAVTRIHLLMLLGEENAARDEWLYLLAQSDQAQQRTLADLAQRHEWHELAIRAALRSGDMNALSWRFPPAYDNEFRKAGEAFGLDHHLLMSVARRESSFQPGVRSPAGAIGLMQLMPGTAHQVQRWRDEAAVPQSRLQEAGLNIQLGSTYLATLLTRYQNNRLLALAAYNAGMNRVDTWLQEMPDLPFDIWIESIPFRETRDYVQAVLAYRVIFASLYGQDTSDLAMLSSAEKGILYGVALKPEQPLRETALLVARRNP